MNFSWSFIVSFFILISSLPVSFINFSASASVFGHLHEFESLPHVEHIKPPIAQKKVFPVKALGFFF